MNAEGRLGVVGLVSVSLSSSGSNESILHLPTPPPPTSTIGPRLSDADLASPLIPPGISGFVGVSGDSASFSVPLEPFLERMWDSSIAVNTLLNFDSAFVPPPIIGGCEFILNTPNASFCWGDFALCCGGDFGGGVVVGVRDGEETSAHAEFVSVKYPPAPICETVGIQLGLVGLIPRSRVSTCGVETMLVGPGEVVVISGGRMEKIWSSVVGGP